MIATPEAAPRSPDETTYMRPVSNCAGCGDTKVSWSVFEGLKKFGGVVAVETTVVFPQPESLYKKLITKLSIEKICVFEEGYGRVIYMQLLALVNRHGLDAKVFDCSIPYEPRIYERFSYIDHVLAD